MRPSLSVQGTGAGVYTWIKGELLRSYAKDFTHTEKAVIHSLDYLKIAIDEKIQEGSETTIKARQENNSPVTVKIRTVRYDMTEVAIRCGGCRLLGPRNGRTDSCHHPQHHLIRIVFWPRFSERWLPIICWCPETGVLVGVSGGPDSMALLHLLSRLAPELNIRMGVAHLKPLPAWRIRRQGCRRCQPGLRRP